MKTSTKFLNPLVVLLFFVFSITSCNEKAKESEEPATLTAAFNLTTAKTEIEAANKQFMAFIAVSDTVSLSNLYTQDAKVMLTGAPAVIGRKNIQSTFSGMLNSGITSVDLRTIGVWGVENLVTEEGEYSLFVGDDEVDQGKYLVLWKREDGNWKLFRDIFNSNIQAE